MKDLKVFENPEFGKLTVTEKDNNPWLIGSEVARILGYSNPQKAIRDHVDDDDKLTERIVLAGQTREVIIINESGLYSLVLSSKLPTAKKFKRWITHEVIPAIRKHGAYMTEDTLEKALTSPDFLIQLATQLKEEKEKRLAAEKQIEMDRPKTIFADAVSASHTSILVGEMAKILRGNGVEIGQKRFFDWLRENGYLIRRKGTDYNMPTQRAMELGLFEIKEGSYVNGSGVNIITKTPKITGKGQQYFVNKFLTDTRR